MKLNIADPDTGSQKTVDIEDEKALLPFIEKRMGQDVPGDSLGEEFKGYMFRITGGNDKQGFPMMQGIMKDGRVRILFRQGMPCYRARRKGQMKRRSVRGCVVDYDLAVMSLKIVRKGPSEIAGVTDEKRPRRLGPKRAGKIRKMYNLGKDDDVRKFVVRRKTEYDSKQIKDGGTIEVKKTICKAPRIQRLVTQQRLQHKRRYKNILVERSVASKKALDEYKKMLEKYKSDKRAARAKELGKTKAAALKTDKTKAQPKTAASAKVAAKSKAQAKTVQAKTAQPKAAQAKSAAKPKVQSDKKVAKPRQ